MRVVGYRPRNLFLHRPLDRSWHTWLSRCGIGAAAVSVTLGALVGPRQETVRLRYEIAAVQQAVDALERERRQLLLERETLTSPTALVRELGDLGLATIPRDRVAYLTPDGRLVPAPVPTPGPAQGPRPRKDR
ncbi:MAG: hypothetical protein ACM3O7_09070 [Acidobacteriota bacterium]